MKPRDSFSDLQTVLVRGTRCWFLPGGYEDPANPVILDDSAHGSDSLPLPGVVGVVVLGQLPGQAVDAGHCSPIAQVGHDHLAVFDENTGGCNGPNMIYMSVLCCTLHTSRYKYL